MSYRARCKGRREARRWTLYNRARRAHERVFLALEAMQPPEVTGDPIADMWAREIYGMAKSAYRSANIFCYLRFKTWTERYREGSS